MTVHKIPQCESCGRPINVERSKQLSTSACKDWPFCACAVEHGQIKKIDPITIPKQQPTIKELRRMLNRTKTED